MVNKSILTTDHSKLLLNIAKKVMETRDLNPVIILKFKDESKPVLVPVLNQSSDNKAKIDYMISLKSAIAADPNMNKLGELIEAVMVSDVYYLKAGKSLKPDQLPIRNNAERREAVVIFGRNKTGDKYINEIYPYTRVDNKVVFTKPDNSNTGKSVGLIDYLFNDPKLIEKLQDKMFKTPDKVTTDPELVN